MIKTLFCIVVLAASAAFGQTPDIPPPTRLPFIQLTRYLDLTAQQVIDLVRINGELGRFLAQKQQRAAQVREEIAVETKRETVDPMSLGLRYAELEAICREARAKESETVRSARAVLQTPQIEKLRTLEQAVALLPTAGEAAEAHLLSRGPGAGIRLLMPVDRPLPGCMATQPEVVINPSPIRGPM